jgi:hypothetical protein
MPASDACCCHLPLSKQWIPIMLRISIAFSFGYSELRKSLSTFQNGFALSILSAFQKLN